MTDISASAVKELRERTGAGMMDCKRALVETGGDIEQSIDWLRKKGLSSAAKKAGRVACEGLVGVAVQGKRGALVEVNAETDFVSRNQQFQSFVSQVASLGAMGVQTLEALKSSPYGASSSRSVGEELVHLISVIGENMTLRRLAALQVSSGTVAGYVHSPVVAGLGRIGVLVALEGTGPESNELGVLAKQIAMHIAASSPQSLSVEDLDPALLEREKAVLQEQARASGKPEAVIEKMIEGRIKKYYEEVVLLEQPFIMNPDQKVKDLLGDFNKKNATDFKIAAFARFSVGEGIEKSEGDFAAEVASLSK